MFLLRKSGWMDYIVGALFCLAIAVAAIGANPWKGQTSSPLDLLVSYPGWGSQVAKSELRSRERSDALDARLPQWIYARNEIREGRVPLWNDTSAGGDASILKLTSGQLTPAFAIFTAIEDPAKGFYFSVLFNLFIAGLGMFVFLRSHLGLAASLFGTVMFQLCGFNVAWLFWSHVLTLMWLPWLLWSLNGLLRDTSPRWFALTSMFTALLLVGGFPFVAQLSIGAAGLYLMFYGFGYGVLHANRMGWPKDVLRRVTIGMLALASGLLVVAIPLLTFFEWLQQFSTDHRGAGSHMTLATHAKLLLRPWAFASPRVESAMYVGTLGSVFAALGILSFWIRRDRVAALGLYAIAIIAVALALAFQLIPVRTVSWIPGLGMNAWSRAISLLCVGLAIAAAVFVQRLAACPGGQPTVRTTVALLLAALLLGQAYDQLKFYREFNGPTKAAFFYPQTQVLDYVNANSGAFDYAVADTSYIISGSLGAYGIREWFAHRFKTQALRNVLPALAKNPFATATASSLQPQNIRYEAEQMALMNVRYVLTRQPEIPADHGLQGAADGQPLRALSNISASGWQQRVVIPQSVEITRISVRFATHRANDLDGLVTAALLDSEGNQLHIESSDASMLLDNAYLDFDLQAPLPLHAGGYTLDVQYQPGAKNRPLTAWSAAQTDSRYALVVDGDTLPAALDYRIEWGASDTAFRKVMAEGRISLWENKRSPNGPYFVDSLENPVISLGDTAVTYYTPGRFKVAYRGNTPGYVVIPMEATRDWISMLDDQPVQPEKLLGVLPAIRVEGPTQIEFAYQPRSLRILPYWAFAMGVLVLALGYWSIRRSRRPPDLTFPTRDIA